MGLNNFLPGGLFKLSRSQTKAANNLGVTLASTICEGKYRDVKLEVLDAYYENRQYCHLVPWDTKTDSSGTHIPLRSRAPKIRYNFAKTFSQRVTSKLVGSKVFPSFKIEDSPDDQEFIKAVIRESKLKAAIIEPVRRMLASGSVMMRFYLSGGSYKVEWYATKYCYPVFQENGDLESVSIKYTYEDKQDKDEKGTPKTKWYRLDLGMNTEILFDNPEYKENQEPEFTEVDRVEHNLGFVQAEWFKTADIPNSPDGYSLNEDILEFIDEMNYSLSQSSNSVSYNQDPQLTFTKMDEEETANLVRSVTKSWNLGREGEAKFLESNLNGVQRAIELRDKIRLNIQDITRVLLLDPEKMVASAQSGRAMEVLHGPMLDLVSEIRPMVEDALKRLILKMALATLIASRQGIPVPIDIPPGYQPASLELKLDWPDVFPMTLEDLQKKVTVASTVTTANLISRATATKWLSKEFEIEDIEAEIAAIAAQPPPPNPFGGF